MNGPALEIASSPKSFRFQVAILHYWAVARREFADQDSRAATVVTMKLAGY